MRLLDGLTSPCRVSADYNEVNGDEMWAVLLRGHDPVAADLAVGDVVDLYDEDGMSCWGRITERRGRSIRVHLLWGTFRDPVVVHWSYPVVP